MTIPEKTIEDYKKEIEVLRSTDVRLELERLRGANHALDNENKKIATERAKALDKVDELTKKNAKLEATAAEKEAEYGALRIGMVGLYACLLSLQSWLFTLRNDIEKSKVGAKKDRSLIVAEIDKILVLVDAANKAGQHDYAARAKEHLLFRIWSRQQVSDPVIAAQLERIMEHGDEYFVDPDVQADIWSAKTATSSEKAT